MPHRIAGDLTAPTGPPHHCPCFSPPHLGTLKFSSLRLVVTLGLGGVERYSGEQRACIRLKSVYFTKVYT